MSIPLISAKQLGHKSGVKPSKGTCDRAVREDGNPSVFRLWQQGVMADIRPLARHRWVGRGSISTHGEHPSPQCRQRPSLAWSIWELLAVLVASLLLLCILLHYQAFHFYVAQAYAHLGYPHAQHIVGQRYLQGAGVEKNEKLAMHWFSFFSLPPLFSQAGSRTGPPTLLLQPGTGSSQQHDGGTGGRVNPAAPDPSHCT
ncbi:UNVERIFIED_CONTAM: hypothetical protein H355_010146 [Colinus virginianus]|nr:hypothetical protein H355_010146 [Colinus virginianus]